MKSTRELGAQELNATSFWARVQVGAADECWPWLSARNQAGYGVLFTPMVRTRRRSVRAHRAAYALTHGRLPADGELDHLCRNRICVNPLHLELVTARVNISRGLCPTAAATRARLQGRCLNGHVIADVGLYRSCGREMCAQCCRDSSARYRERVTR